MKTMKLNVEMLETAAIAFALGVRPIETNARRTEVKVGEIRVRPTPPAWAWGFSPMLPWGSLKEGV